MPADDHSSALPPLLPPYVPGTVPQRLEDDIEMFPLALLTPEYREKRKSRARSLKEVKYGRSASLSRIDTSDMKPIVDYFSSVTKRKAVDNATSPSSEAVAKMTRNDMSNGSPPDLKDMDISAADSQGEGDM